MHLFKAKPPFSYKKFTTGNRYFKKGPHLRPSDIDIFKGMAAF